MAAHLKLRTSDFTRKYCETTDGFYHLKEFQARGECLFLKDRACTVYEGRPTQCRTWPFWPENMGAKSWDLEVASYCPGAGKGELISAETIQAALDAQVKSEQAL